jgi:hypothetical protein
MSNIAGLKICQVWRHDPEMNALYVILPASNQPIMTPVQMGREWGDAVRVNQHELPAVGSWGVVLFPGGVDINGIWIATIHPSMMDALTSGPTELDSFLNYKSYFSNIYWLQDSQGNVCWSHPSTETGDGTGTWIVIGQSPDKPPVYRHIVNAQTQEQERVQFKDSERVPAVPAPYIHLHHTSGTDIQIFPNGNAVIAVTGNLTASASGDVSISCGTSGNISLTQLGQTVNDLLVSNNLLIAAFNAHTHAVVGAATTPPDIPWTTSTVSIPYLETFTP